MQGVVFPVQIWILLVLCLLVSCVGFYKLVYFISIGYGFAVCASGAALLVIYHRTYGFFAALQCVLFMVYGIRLGGFLLLREIKSASYRKVFQQVRGDAQAPLLAKLGTWISVCLLYVMEVSPVLYRGANGDSKNWSAAVGAVLMICALVLESLADATKSAFKKKNPHRFCDTGVFKLVRCPNYLGEMLFWTAVFLSSFGSVRGWQWLVVLVGWLGILYIMFGSARRLDIRQEKNYGSDPEFQAYTAKTPILLPFIPLYHLKDAGFFIS